MQKIRRVTDHFYDGFKRYILSDMINVHIPIDSLLCYITDTAALSACQIMGFFSVNSDKYEITKLMYIIRVGAGSISKGKSCIT